METEHLFFEETSEKEEMCYPCTLILLTTDIRYYSMVQNILIIVSATMGVDNNLKPWAGEYIIQENNCAMF